jgi:hypothetical protein
MDLKNGERMDEYKYTDEDYKELEKAHMNSNLICYGRPDQFQYYQNELSQAIATFIMKPYQYKNQKKEEENKHC